VFTRYILPRFRYALGRGNTGTSWFRTPEENFRVGGEPESQHQLGFAFDAVGDWEGVRDRAKAAGLFPVIESDHIHVQVMPAGWAW